MVGKHMEDKSKKKELNEITDDDIILDIGPKTTKKIKDIIEKAKLFYGMVQQVILKTQILQMVVTKLQKQL